MIGMRPLEPIAPAPEALQPGETEANPDPRSDGTQGDPAGPAAPSHRVRARVRYDSSNEPLPVIQRRARALRGLALLVVLAAAWLGYRYLTLHG